MNKIHPKESSFSTHYNQARSLNCYLVLVHSHGQCKGDFYLFGMERIFNQQKNTSIWARSALPGLRTLHDIGCHLFPSSQPSLPPWYPFDPTAHALRQAENTHRVLNRRIQEAFFWQCQCHSIPVLICLHAYGKPL